MILNKLPPILYYNSCNLRPTYYYRNLLSFHLRGYSNWIKITSGMSDSFRVDMIYFWTSKPGQGGK